MGTDARDNTIQEKKTHKVGDAEFWRILRENGGLFARTARAIERKYNITFGRSAVKQRADKDPEQLQDIIEETLDVAEEGLQSMIRSAPPNIRLSAIQFFLKAKGKSRGYGEKPLEISATATPYESSEEGGNMGSLNLTIQIVGNND